MSAATPAPIWWVCLDHEVRWDYDEEWDGVEPYPGWCHANEGREPCNIVQRRLVDPSALVVERDATAGWPEAMIEEAAKAIFAVDQAWLLAHHEPPEHLIPWEELNAGGKKLRYDSARAALDALEPSQDTK